MPKLDNPFSKNHYDFLNECLSLQNAEKLQQHKQLLDLEKGKLLNKIAEFKDDLTHQKDMAIKEEDKKNIDENLKKLARAQEDLLTTLENQKAYDAKLSIKPSAKLQGGGKSIGLIPLVDIGEITKEFDAFVKEQIGKPKPGGDGVYAAGDFKHIEDPPGTHVYTFPDEQSLKDFVQRLFNKNMAMLPSGSQNINDVFPQKAINRDPIPLSVPKTAGNKNEKASLNSPK